MSSGDYHHCDISTFKYFSVHTPLVVPKGLGRFLSKYLPNPITEAVSETITTVDGVSLQPWENASALMALRPWRGCPQLNFMLRHHGETFLFIFYEPDAASLATWQREAIDVVFVSLGGSPWKKLLRPQQLPAIAKAAAHLFSHARTIIPIGWGGFPISRT